MDRQPRILVLQPLSPNSLADFSPVPDVATVSVFFDQLDVESRLFAAARKHGGPPDRSVENGHEGRFDCGQQWRC